MIGCNGIMRWLLEVRKDAGKLAEVEGQRQLSAMRGTVGIAHTCWAMMGCLSGKCASACQCGWCFAIVHNGVIENYLTFKSHVAGEGVYVPIGNRFGSDQSISLPHTMTMGIQCRRGPGSHNQATARGVAFALLNAYPGDTVVRPAREPLVIGVGEATRYLASDVNAFARYTRQAVFLNDGEYAVLRPHDYTIKSLRTAAVLPRVPVPIAWSNGHRVDKGSYPHFMLKEIHEGADCITAALAIPKAEGRRTRPTSRSQPQAVLHGHGHRLLCRPAGAILLRDRG